MTEERELTFAANRDAFSTRLWVAIKRKGITYLAAARLASRLLPGSERISDVSVWSYAKGKSFPRKIAHIIALGKALDFETDDIVIQNHHVSHAED